MAILSPHTHGALVARERAQQQLQVARDHFDQCMATLALARETCARDDMAALRIAVDRAHADALALQASLATMHHAAACMLRAEVARQSHEQGGS